MTIVFHPEAAEEFEAAVDWYETREIGLGLDFAVEIHAAIQRASAMPNAWTRLSGNVRAAYWSIAFPMVFSMNQGTHICSCWP
jgi:hypothetical protein